MSDRTDRVRGRLPVWSSADRPAGTSPDRCRKARLLTLVTPLHTRSVFMSITAKNFENGARAAADSTVSELNRVVAQAEELLKTLGEEGGAAAEAIRARATRALNQARVRLSDAGVRARDASINAARATDEY